MEESNESWVIRIAFLLRDMFVDVGESANLIETAYRSKAMVSIFVSLFYTF